MSTDDAGLYATLAQFEAFFGQPQLRELLGRRAEAEDAPARYREHLSSATGRINSSLQRGGYAVPIVAEVIDPALRLQTLALLKTHCCALTGLQLCAGLINLPGGLKRIADDATTWLGAIETRKMDLLGVSRSSVNVTAEVTASVQFVPTGERTYPPGYHDRARRVPLV